MLQHVTRVFADAETCSQQSARWIVLRRLNAPFLGYFQKLPHCAHGYFSCTRCNRKNEERNTDVLYILNVDLH